MSKLNKVVVVLDEKAINEIANGKLDKRTLNTGRPVNKKSARQIRLNKQAFYSNVNNMFVSGKAFKLNKNSAQEFRYAPSHDGDGGCLFNGIGSHECNIDYIGRTKATGYAFVLNKRVKVELNLKTLKFVS